MSPATAQKLVLAFVALGTVLTFLTAGTAKQRYRQIWGLFLLGALAAALSDFAPALVGPFVALVLVAYLASHSKQIGGAVNTVEKQAKGSA